MDAEVPRRLRAEREQQGMSVREMARRLSVSPSAISQIETGRARPSVSLLYSIVSELSMSLDELFASGRPAPGAPAPVPPAVPSAASRTPSSRVRSAGPVQRADSRVTIDLDTGIRWERLTSTSDPSVDFLYVTYPPGSSSSAETLVRHQGREYGIVLAGELTVTAGFETYDLGPGDSMSFDSAIPHRLSNLGTEPVTGVWVVIGRNG
jgi:DNA-binding XRE family transcriptional regulator/quercetin dioxygenase-like cupin family protein